MPVLLSVNVGLPKNVAWQGQTVFTGVWKHPVHGPAMARRLNIDGDGQGDTNGHGGEQRAVLVYQIRSYQYWQRHLGREDFGYGTFGENLTVDGLPDDEVCIGDRYRIGEAEFEVTQPRVTCYRVGLRLGEPELPALLVSHHRPGFYLRVITEGRIPAVRSCRKRTGGHLRPQRHHHALRGGPAQRAWPRRRLRRPHPLELPDRRLPYLHHAPAVRRRHLLPGPAGASSRRAGAHLLRPARHRHRPGHVGGRRHDDTTPAPDIRRRGKAKGLRGFPRIPAGRVRLGDLGDRLPTGTRRQRRPGPGLIQ
jgi:MOSC domain-containing protein YiiM